MSEKSNAKVQKERKITMLRFTLLIIISNKISGGVPADLRIIILF